MHGLDLDADKTATRIVSVLIDNKVGVYIKDSVNVKKKCPSRAKDFRSISFSLFRLCSHSSVGSVEANTHACLLIHSSLRLPPCRISNK